MNAPMEAINVIVMLGVRILTEHIAVLVMMVSTEMADHAMMSMNA